MARAALTREQRRALDRLIAARPDPAVYLAGGCAVTAGFAEAIAERTQVPTEIMSPFQGMELAPTIRERQLRLDAPALMVGCGLAMRRFDA